MQLSIPEKIKTARLQLQPLRYEDAEEIFYVYASKSEATRFVSWPTHQKIDATRDFLDRVIHGWKANTDFSFSIRLKSSGRFIGSFGMVHDAGKIQFGYILGPLHWGQGYATETCMEMMPLISGMENIYRVGTFIDSENTASEKVLRKAGLVEEARLPNWMRFPNQNNKPKDCIFYKLPLTNQHEK